MPIKNINQHFKKLSITLQMPISAFEADTIANCVCAWFGLDTAEYSFPYIAGWAADRPRNVLQESMDLIRTTSGNIIEEMSLVFKEHGLMKGQDLDIDQVNDFYEIYQIDPNGKAKARMFLGYDYLESHGFRVLSDDYKNVYQGPLTEGTTLESLYETFNLHHPEDFPGHSLSVGDVVLLGQGGKRQAFFVDTIGFKEIPGFTGGMEKRLEMDRKKPQTLSGRPLKERRKEVDLCQSWR